MNIYCVWGYTGEYSDRSEWPVVWYATKEEADAAQQAYTAAYMRLLGIASPDDEPKNWYDDRKRIEVRMKAIDPEFEMYYTGTSYEVIEVPPGKTPAEIAALVPADAGPTGREGESA